MTRKQSSSVGLAMLAAMAVGIAAFAPARHHAFVYDDIPIVAQNPLVTQSGPWYRFWQAPWWPREVCSDTLYRPLTLCSFRLNAWLAGGRPLSAESFHLVNIALHALTAAGVALAAYRLSRNSAGAWIAGLLFAAHPVHTEAVVTIVGRAELLCGCFAVWLIARSLRDEAPGPLGHAFNALLYLAAVMSKEQGVLLWPVLMLADVLRRQAMPVDARPPWRVWFNRQFAPAQIGLILATAFFLYLRYRVFGWVYVLDPSRIGAWESPLTHATAIERWLTPFRLTWLAVQLTFWPAKLCPLWSVPALLPADGLASDVLAGMALWAGGLGLWLWSLRRSARLAAVVTGCLLMLCLPVHMLPVAHWLFAERWLYLPVALGVVLMAALLARLRSAGVALAVAGTLICLPFTWQYAACFSDTLIMCRETVLRQPDNYQGRRNIAILLYRGGLCTAAIQEASEMVERFDRHEQWSRRFGRPHLPYLILAHCFVELGDGHRALEALDEYEKIRAGIVEMGVTELREKAHALIEQESSSRAPASTSSPGS